MLAEAQRRGSRPSEVVRAAVEMWLRARSSGVVDIRAYAGQNMTIVTPTAASKTENFNLVVQVEASPDRVEVVETVA